MYTTGVEVLIAVVEVPFVSSTFHLLLSFSRQPSGVFSVCTPQNKPPLVVK